MTFFIGTTAATATATAAAKGKLEVTDELYVIL